MGEIRGDQRERAEEFACFAPPKSPAAVLRPRGFGSAPGRWTSSSISSSARPGERRVRRDWVGVGSDLGSCRAGSRFSVLSGSTGAGCHLDLSRCRLGRWGSYVSGSRFGFAGGRRQLCSRKRNSGGFVVGFRICLGCRHVWSVELAIGFVGVRAFCSQVRRVYWLVTGLADKREAFLFGLLILNECLGISEEYRIPFSSTEPVQM